MQRADLTTRAVAGLIDLLLVISLARLPDVLGFLSAAGYILIRDGLFDHRSVGKKLLGLRAVASDDSRAASCRKSIIRNAPLVAAYFLFLVPYAGWVLGPLALGLECLTALGDNQGMRTGDLLAGTRVVLDVPVPAAPETGPVRQTGTVGPRDSE